MGKKKVELKVLEISHSQTQAQAYALLLGEVNGNRQLPLIIGALEAQVITFALKGITPPRPFTHDLFQSILDKFTISITEILIHSVKEGIFYAHISFEKDKEEFYLDARPSDAIALALRTGCPVYIYESILKAESLNVEPYSPVVSNSGEKLEVLRKALNKAIKSENYELASLLYKQIREIEGENNDSPN